MIIRLRANVHKVEAERLALSALSGREGYYLEYDPEGPMVRGDASLLASAYLNHTGDFLISVELSQGEIEALLAARLELDAEGTLKAIGRVLRGVSLQASDAPRSTKAPGIDEVGISDRRKGILHGFGL